MALPTKIQIGCVGYKVCEIEDLHNVNSDGQKQWLHGHILLADAIIKVGVDQDEQIKLVTLWHEALHGILHHAGIKDQPEGVVETLGYGIVQLLRDNPELITLTIQKEQSNG